MKTKGLYSTIAMIALFMIFVGGCGKSESEENSKKELKIAAASDLTLAFSEIGTLFEEETGAKVTFSFGSTGQLSDQIENGAPFDLFAAAHVKYIDSLRDKDLILPETQTSYAFGRIGIAAQKKSSLKLEKLDDLLKPEVKKIAIANPDHAPYGLAAKQALEAAGIWDKIEGKLVYGRNIADTLTFLETGNVEAAIIAHSLYKENQMNFQLIDDTLHAPLEQALAVVHTTKQEQTAKEFISFIKGPLGKPIMEKYGFDVPEGK